MRHILRFIFRLLWRWWLAEKVITWIKKKLHIQSQPSQETHTP